MHQWWIVFGVEAGINKKVAALMSFSAYLFAKGREKLMRHVETYETLGVHKLSWSERELGHRRGEWKQSGSLVSSQ